MLRGARELWLALLAIILISILYIVVVIYYGSIPAASDFFGHSLGILGFLLMLLTETLYSFRKRSRSARWGRTSTWLQFHIFTGLVGPYLVLLHSSWKFQGLAGVVMFMTLMITASGFIGRYIYTAVPRAADGAMLEAADIQESIAQAKAQIEAMVQDLPPDVHRYSEDSSMISLGDASGSKLVLERVRSDWKFRRMLSQYRRKLSPGARAQAMQIEALISRRRDLERQIRSIAAARRLLSLWHSVHIPFGVALFSAAFVHILGAVYYATLLH